MNASLYYITIAELTQDLAVVKGGVDNNIYVVKTELRIPLKTEDDEILEINIEP
jgi:hypothetical protein